MIHAVTILLAGLVGLVVAGAAIVRSAGDIGGRLGLSPTVVGMTIVAAGTSAPELAVVWRAADEGDPSLALGSVVGSNIANVLLVLGAVALLGAIPVESRSARVDVPVMVGASAVTFALAADGAIGRSDGAVLLAGLVVFVGATIRQSRRTGDSHTAASATRRPNPSSSWPAALALFAAGAGGVALSARWVVDGAEEIALELGVPQLVVGLTVLAIGTSAPEIATSVIAAMRGHREVAFGNAIGSNVFNLLFVLGAVSATHSDLPVDDALVRVDLPVMLVAAAVCVPIALTGRRISRVEGGVLVAMYVGYVTFLCIDAVS